MRYVRGNGMYGINEAIHTLPQRRVGVLRRFVVVITLLDIVCRAGAMGSRYISLLLTDTYVVCDVWVSGASILFIAIIAFLLVSGSFQFVFHCPYSWPVTTDRRSPRRLAQSDISRRY